MKNPLVLAVIVIVALAAIGVAVVRSVPRQASPPSVPPREALPAGSPAQAPSPPSAAQQAPRAPAEGGDEFGISDLTFADLNGTPVQLSAFRGKPLVVNSWAAWCPFCAQELSDFATVQQEVGDAVTIIAIDRAESRDTATQFVQQRGLAPDDLVFLLDPNDTFYSTIGGLGMPETLFLNADGALAFHKRGPMALPEIRQRVRDLR